jgi:uncharacterized phage-associated protein
MDNALQKYKQLLLASIKFGADKSDGKITKTKLAKLAYLSDFSFFYYNLRPISGLEYKKLDYGPVPTEYFELIDLMFDSGEIKLEVSGSAQMVSLIENPNFNLLDSNEIDQVKKVAQKWSKSNTDQIVRFTHAQLPWKISRDREPIPYELIVQEAEENVY